MQSSIVFRGLKYLIILVAVYYIVKYIFGSDVSELDALLLASVVTLLLCVIEITYYLPSSDVCTRSLQNVGEKMDNVTSDSNQVNVTQSSIGQNINVPGDLNINGSMKSNIQTNSQSFNINRQLSSIAEHLANSSSSGSDNSSSMGSNMGSDMGSDMGSSMPSANSSNNGSSMLSDNSSDNSSNNGSSVSSNMPSINSSNNGSSVSSDNSSNNESSVSSVNSSNDSNTRPNTLNASTTPLSNVSNTQPNTLNASPTLLSNISNTQPNISSSNNSSISSESNSNIAENINVLPTPNFVQNNANMKPESTNKSESPVTIMVKPTVSNGMGGNINASDVIKQVTNESRSIGSDGIISDSSTNFDKHVTDISEYTKVSQSGKPLKWYEYAFDPRKYSGAEGLKKIAVAGGKTRDDILVKEAVYEDFNRLPPSFVKNDYEPGYSFMPPKDWYPLPPYPPVCVSSCKVDAKPYYMDTLTMDLKEWEENPRIMPPDAINTDQIIKFNSA